MSRKQKVIIDVNSNMTYSSYYIEGLYEYFGKNNVTFSHNFFKDLNRKDINHPNEQLLAFIILKNNKTIKIVVDFSDHYTINYFFYEWCDKYAKINFNKTYTDFFLQEKIIPIPPSFGINIWSYKKAIFTFITNLVLCRFSPIVPILTYRRQHLGLKKRPRWNEYLNTSNNNINNALYKKYIFMIATLWSNENCIDETNLMRKKFIEICESLGCNFEGGFYGNDNNHPQYKDFKKNIFNKKYTTEQYINKTKLSALVFNTPAVHRCHGWKLGEYLAMGKAIISMPLFNDLPINLVHGEHIHFVSNLYELEQGITKILNDDDYRRKLEDGAKRYFSLYGYPKMVIENIINNTNQTL